MIPRTPRQGRWPVRAWLAALAFGLGASSGAHAAPAHAYVTTEGGDIAVIDLDTLRQAAAIPAGGKGPRGLGLTPDGKLLLAANKGTGDMTVVDIATGKVVRHVPIGDNPEFVRVHGGQAFVTYEPGERAGRPGSAPPAEKSGKAGDDVHEPAEIAVVDLKTWKVTRRIRSGVETEGIDFSRDGKQMLVTNEGDDTVTVYDRATGQRLKLLEMPKGSRPRGIKASPDGRRYVVTLENGNAFAVLDASDFRITRTVPTGAGPYGVTFDRSGARLFVAASRAGTLQVFDTQDFAHITDIPVGKRCWHFSFSPDDSKLLVACGRSDAVMVFDGRDYKPLAQIDGLPLAWGIVTWPKSVGTIESP